MNCRYHYLIHAIFVLDGNVGSTPISVHLDIPISSAEDLTVVREGVIKNLAHRDPLWDRMFRGWRDTVEVVAFSMLRIEVEHCGRWVLADWQPWGPLNPR